MALASDLKKAGVRSTPQPEGLLWRGPIEEGVSQSLLTNYLTCKERFRVKVVEGLASLEHFNPVTDYGNMWHVCEEALAAAPGDTQTKEPQEGRWQVRLEEYCRKLCQRFPTQQDQIDHWYKLSLAFFPEYERHWREHPDVRKRTPLLQEQVFAVDYALPSGRVVKLRGKWDAVDLIEEAPVGIYVQENKTKSTIDFTKVQRQLRFDLQTLFYVIALVGSRQRYPGKGLKRDYPVNGVRYNVVRRPAHKTAASALEKYVKDLRDGREGEWWARWRVEVSSSDVQRFRRQCLDPLLENLCDDYEWWNHCYDSGQSYGVWDHRVRQATFTHHRPRHFVMPYVGYSPLLEGGSTELDHYLESGSTVGLRVVDTLFPELT